MEADARTVDPLGHLCGFCTLWPRKGASYFSFGYTVDYLCVNLWLAYLSIWQLTLLDRVLSLSLYYIIL